MLSTFINYALPFSATLLIASVLCFIVSGAYLFFFNLRATHHAFQHPYLKQYTWAQLPWSLKTGVLLDYFLRLNFPKQDKWICGQANKLLAHTQIEHIPLKIKWPLMGFWGGCLVGLLSMGCIWVLIAAQASLL